MIFYTETMERQFSILAILFFFYTQGNKWWNFLKNCLSCDHIYREIDLEAVACFLNAMSTE